MKPIYWITILLAASTIVLGIKLGYQKNDGTGSDAATDGGNAALECIMTRASVREYTDSVVPDSIIEKVLRAGMAAPTAANAQPWELVVITDQALKDSIASTFKYCKQVGNSAFSVIVCGNMNKLFEGDGDSRESGYWIQDCSAMSENMLLAAHALGLGGVWCGIFPVKERVRQLREIVAIPDSLEPLNVIAFGYPEGKPQPKQKWDAEKVHYNRF